MIRGYTDISFGLPTKFFYPSLNELRCRQHEKNNFLHLLKTAGGPQNPRIRMNYILTSLRICRNLTLLAGYFFFIASSFLKIFNKIFFVVEYRPQKFWRVFGSKKYFDAFQCILSSLRYKMTPISLTNPEII